MIFDSSGQGTLAAPEDICRRQNGLPDSRAAGELELDRNGNRSKSFRRKRIDLRKIRSISETNSLISSDLDFSLKKKRFEVKNEPALEVDLPQNDVIGSGEAKLQLSHGTVSTIGRRREMEDAVAVELGFLKRSGGKSYNFYGVYDGHGGWRVAHACSEMLHKVLAKAVEEESGEEIAWESVMAAGFKEMDVEVNKKGAAVATMGSTAVVAVVGAEQVVVANCGDSRAVLCRGGVPVQLSDDHKPDRPDELERIEVCGGKVINWNGQRVLGVLATSRSIGDEYLKPYVITEPEVRIINTSNSDEFLILASDGLWDVISNDVACQVTRRCLDGRIRSKIDNNISDNRLVTSSESRCAQAAGLLAELAMAKGSTDNISVIVVDLKFS
ncbi:hypothetical protein ABFS82_06G022700 [Erythranthe guttata]|uniref:protein-serine/threonine phosphatase n=1 Tax=Erythranthe guttata TaxID=4155 RepID=A0A022QFC1_ERYGU|nr:PREDICTED: probable protein phosphatase 2C 51 [Erythranthe guttata]EYU25210.1 hypothetical protein MIMGU_mgv1a008111mg [Erythranthe guttata]|eukprot:XP_012851967.1 PREDICTED: probable protein phosphatase 2C 51 [Erythranthe guttata]